MFNPYHHIFMFVFYQNYVYIRIYISSVFLVVFVHQKVSQKRNIPFSSLSPYKTDRQATFVLTLHLAATKSCCSSFVFVTIIRESHHTESITRHLQARSANALNDTRYWVFRNLRRRPLKLFVSTCSHSSLFVGVRFQDPP